MAIHVSAREASVWYQLLYTPPSVCVFCAISHSLALTHPSNNYLYFLSEIVFSCFSIAWLVCSSLWLTRFIVRIKRPIFVFLAFLCGWLFIVAITSSPLTVRLVYHHTYNKHAILVSSHSNMVAVTSSPQGWLDLCANSLYRCCCG